VEGVGVPGHFLVRHLPQAGTPQLIDVFDRGAPLTREDVLRRVIGQGVEWRESFLDAATPREIILRMLRNLLGLAQANEDRTAELRYVRVVLALQPDSVADRLHRAVLGLSIARPEEGLADVDWVLERRPEGVDLDRVAELREALLAIPIETLVEDR
jgi:regulator of sirC expression with transglutaminase-like and TPR domain